MIRRYKPTDMDAVRALYPLAFPDEDLVELVGSLSQHAECRALVAEDDDGIIGHAAITACHIAAGSVDLLGPVAVRPDRQASGLGGALIQAAIDISRGGDAAAILVLGAPDLYGKFGFHAENKVVTPFLIPDEWADAWQSIWFERRPASGPQRLVVPAPWQDASLWA